MLSHGRKGWMFRDISLPEWLFNIDAVSSADITKAVMAIHRDYPAAKAKVKKAMTFVADQQKATMQVVRKTLKSTS